MWKVEQIVLTVCSTVFLVILVALSTYKIAQSQVSEVFYQMSHAYC